MAITVENAACCLCSNPSFRKTAQILEKQTHSHARGEALPACVTSCPGLGLRGLRELPGGPAFTAEQEGPQITVEVGLLS